MQTTKRSLLKAALGLGVAGALPTAPSLLAQTNSDLDAGLFPGFRASKVQTSGAIIHTLVGGSGPPILLLHGAPQAHFSWAKVAVELARDYTVVVTDLRGYGYSSKPEGGENHINYSKRTMAQDQVEVMASLGYDRFILFGHDRGGRVGRRLTLDHPERVEKLAVLDIVPAHYLYSNTTREFAVAYIHWFMFIRPAPFAENIIAATGMFVGNGSGEIGEEYRRIYSDPAAVHAMCEDYRASANMDMDIDKADIAAGKTIDCPLNVLWGDAAPMGRLYDVLGIWQMEATRAEGKSMPGGHTFQEENPEQTYDELRRFLNA
ncbi:MAG: alpha/beta hydrolase [Proteobacteria bacterium]|nr:alpha/beta hydrolase [Pseudomonadota bacterium]MDA0927418.1 alpha/beta hydrolase [Pseudomonadota bacterium]